MKIKYKLFLGTGSLFAMIILLSILASQFITKLSNDTKNILVANYNTLDYSRQMMIALNNGIYSKVEQQLIEENLAKQLKNITEVGEKELTLKLTNDYNKLKLSPNDSILIKNTRTDITDIMQLNMQAIQRKSNIADETAEKSIFEISIIGTICFLIAFILLVNLPGNIANPIKELSESIKQIASQNYSKRVHFDDNNEFGELATSFNIMAEKLEEYQASSLDKLMLEKKRIDTLINNMRDPVIGLDEKNNIIFMNNTALYVTGLKNEEVLGKRIQDIAVNNDLVRTLIQDLFIEKKINKPVKIYSDNKESFFNKEIIAINIIPTGENEEKFVGNVILLQNITEYKELDFAKTNFLATISHELKTPLSSIKMSVQLLENHKIGNLNEDQIQLMESIKEDANRLLKITSELLNMTQVESGSIQLIVMATTPAEIVEYAINTNHISAEYKQIKFEVKIDPSVSQVLADKEKTAWVLSNLVANAINYSFENSTISIQVIKDRNNVKFSVADTGQGISHQYLDKIFNRYFRIPGSQNEGSGLGLSICKEFIEAQGGNIYVSSELGIGTKFEFELPSS
ncbi:HAMP domain-containing protein [Cytophagaceae bacterium 50C-KIRBA]|uniref:histidine kinase n=1 Tax=Aquirufa beregesia TaxID=2516556 RepID=A0ABX0EU96_9BACT|nr:ATP-binding protein [Aquirufa beregesia]NGZ43643.1 HAMP domain-containing protein [Aquirufa beregesia]